MASGTKDAAKSAAKTAAGEVPAPGMISLLTLISPRDALTRGHHVLRTIQLRHGRPFGTADEITAEEWHETKVRIMEAVGGGRIGVVEHIWQHYQDVQLPAITGTSYSAVIDKDYRAHLGKFLVRDQFITLIARNPEREESDKSGLFGLFSRVPTKAELQRERADAVAVLDQATAAVMRMYRELNPEVLEDYTDSRGRRCNRLMEFFGLLVNGRWERRRSEPGRLYRLLPNVRVSAANGLVELRGIDSTQYAAMFDIAEYKPLVEPGHLDAMLFTRVPFLCTHTFLPMSQRDALASIKRQEGQLKAVEDDAVGQREALASARKAVADKAMEWGEYNFTLATFGATPEEARQGGSIIASDIQQHSGIRIVACDAVPGAAWWSQIPGNYHWRTRKAEISSRAYAALAPNHGFSRGKLWGNPWGPAWMMTDTDSGNPFELSLHESRPDEDDEGRMLPGSAAIFGRTGEGKTTLELMLALQSVRFNPAPRLFVADVDNGCEIAVRAMGGTYVPLKNGVPTGINPFQWEVTKARIKNWVALVLACCFSPDEKVTIEHRRDAFIAVKKLASIKDPSQRRMSMLRQLTTKRRGDSIFARLEPWCQGGENDWVFDLAHNVLPPAKEVQVIGFDYTDFLDHPDVRTPLLMALLMYQEDMTDGRRIVNIMAEAWKALDDIRFAKWIKKGTKTVRKLNGLFIFDTQEPEDMIDSEVGRSLISQLTTLLLLADKRASEATYCGRLGLSLRELDIVRNLKADGFYRVLVKQGSRSAVLRFDLNSPHMRDHMLVLSGNKANVELLNTIRTQVGDDPDDWMPVLREMVAKRDASTRAKREAMEVQQ